jgi:multiple sugar transport system ATP-binding protein
MSETHAKVRLRNLGKTYPGGTVAVEKVDLGIEEGEFCVLVGPSGCGKSTTLRMIAGLEEITAGTLEIEGRVVNGVPARDRDIAFVFQNYALYPHLTVAANIGFGLERRREHASWIGALVGGKLAARKAESAAIRTRVLETARILGLEGELGRYPRELSGGQRQRVAVGRAIARKPKVFLFDEPLSNLDARLRLETRAELRQLHRRLGATIVYVTHDQEEAMTLADRLVVMHRGRVQQVAAPLEAYARPANRFVAAFLGTPGMNLLDGRLHRGDGRERFVLGEIAIDLPAGKAAAATPGESCFGIRPDRLRLGAAAAGAPWTGSALVTAIERLGDRMDVTLSIGAARLVARVLPDPAIVEGTAVDVGLDPADGHLFAPGEEGPRVG